MGSINRGRVLLGGLLAGVVINVGEFLLNGLLIADRWEAVWAELGLGTGESTQQMVGWILYSFLLGLFCVWLYAAIRPRYGAGPKTAACAGAAAWFPASALFTLASWNMGIFPADLLVISTLWCLVELPLATIAGAWLYRES